MEVTPAFVSTILSKDKTKRRRKAKATALPVDNLQQLIQAKKLVEQLGGVAKAREAVEVLARIIG